MPAQATSVALSANRREKVSSRKYAAYGHIRVTIAAYRAHFPDVVFGKAYALRGLEHELAAGRRMRAAAGRRIRVII
jgi:hypothetical protein